MVRGAFLNISPLGSPIYLNDSILDHSNRIRFLGRIVSEFIPAVEEVNEPEEDFRRFFDANPDRTPLLSFLSVIPN